MKNFFYIILFLIISLPASSFSQSSEYDIEINKLYGTPSQSTSSRNFLKTDSTGGLQVPGGVQAIFNFSLLGTDIFTNRKALDFKRGADVLQGCGYYRSSFISEYTENSTGELGNCICDYVRRLNVSNDPSTVNPPNCN
jgi:hypothetical protein